MLTETPFAQAVLRILDRVDGLIPPHVQGPIDCVLVGGAAVHILTGYRVSQDIEAIFGARLLLPPDLVVTYDDTDGRKYLHLDTNYTTSIALLHPDALRAALPLLQRRRFAVRVLAPVDLAVTKIGRWAGNDAEDVAALADAGLLTVEAVRQRAEEALDYFIGYGEMVRYNLRDALDIIAGATNDGVEP